MTNNKWAMDSELIKNVPDGVWFLQQNTEIKGRKIEKVDEPVYERSNTKPEHQIEPESALVHHDTMPKKILKVKQRMSKKIFQ